MASSQILKLLAQQQVQNYLNQQAVQQFTPPEVSEDEIAKYQADFDAWKASQSKPKSTPKYESAEIPQLLPQFQGGYVSQNDARRSYKGNSALETLKANKEYLEGNNGAKNEPKEQIKQLDLSGYNFRTSPSEDFMNQVAQKESEDKQREMDMAKARVLLNPSLKLNKQQEKAAEEFALNGLKKYRGMKKSEMTPEQLEEVALYKDLQTKTSEAQSFAIGAATQAEKIAKGIKKLGDLGFMGPAQMLANKVTQPLTDKIFNRLDDTQDVRQMVETQNPIATGAGRFATSAAAYAVTNPAFNTLAGATGATGLGKFALNQAAQGAQDLALDILPTYEEMTKDGPITDAEIQQLAKQFGWDMVGNLAIGVGGELIKKVASLRQASKEAKAANDAFAEGISKRADELAALNEQGYVPPQKYSPQEIASLNTNPVEANNKQFGELMDEFNHQFKDDSAMRNIFTPEDLEASQNSQFTELMKGRPKTIADLAPDEIPEINTELPEIPSFKNVDDYSNMWKADNEIPNIADNAKLPESMPENARRISDEIDGGLWTAGKTMTDYQNSGYFDNVTDPKVLKAWERVQNAYSDYAFKLYETSNADELDKAAKELTSAKKSLSRALEPIDPKAAKDFNVYKENMAIKQPAQKAQTPDWKAQFGEYDASLGDSFGEADKEIGKSIHAEDAVPETQKVFRGVDDDLVMAEDIGLNPKTDLDYTLKEIPESEAPKAGDSFKDTTEVKERGQSKHIRNADTPMKMEDVSDEVVADFEKDPDMYAVLKNKDTKAKAENIYNTSDNPEADFREMLSRKDPAALPLGHQIAKDYSAKGDYSAAAQIYRDMGEALTQSGQFSQAAVINMVKNDPMTALEYAQKELKKLNDIGRQRFKGKWTDFELTPDEINAFKRIQPGDADGIRDVYDLIGTRLGKEYPTTFWEKVIEARRVAMLFNPRTNVRNVLANPPTLAMRWAADRVEAVGQNIAHLIDPNIKVTQSLYGSGVKGRKLAKEIFNGDQVQALLKGSGSKSELPELKNAVMTRKQVFKGTPVSKFIDKMTNGGIQKANEKLFGVKGVRSLAETLRNATYKALDLGDSPFVKENFIERLGSYVAAQGYKSASEVPEEAIMTAWEEAMKATYKDNSWAVGMLRDLKKGMEKADNFIPGLGTSISQSAIPFVQAPGNIAARMTDYSPVGVVRGLAGIISGAKNGNVKAVEKGIEEASKGLTGSGLIYLGMKLRESGVLTGTYSENKKQRAFQKQNGFKEFAIHAGDGYFTYGWAQPFAQELMVGTLLQDAIEKSDEYDSDILKYFGIEGSTAGKAMGVAKEGTRAAVNSWFNESPISGLADFFKGNSFSDTDIAGNIWENGVEDFAGALVPAAVNATAKSLDPVQRNTYDSTNKFASFVNSNIAKIPKLSENLPAKYDTWGNEMRYAQTKAGAAATKFLVPGDYGYDKNDSTDNEINRLFEATGNNSVFPPEADKTIGDQKLDNRQVSTYQEDMGKRNRTFAELFIKSDFYKDLPDKERAEILSNMYGASKAITKRDKFDTEVPESSNYKKAIAAYDNAGGGEKGTQAMINFYHGKQIIADAEISTGSNAAEKAMEQALKGDFKGAEKTVNDYKKYKKIIDENDISTGTFLPSDSAKEIQSLVNSGNTKAAEQYAKQIDTLTSNGLSADSGMKNYQKAKETIPSLTTEQFAKTYKKIDADGANGINQTEVIDYLNNNRVSEAEGKKIWTAYGSDTWKAIPELKDGTWTINKNRKKKK